MTTKVIPISWRICELISNAYIENEYLINSILTSDFKYYCEKNFKEVVVNGDKLTTKQILQFNEVC